MPSSLHRDDVGWYIYSADRDDHSKKRIRRYPFRDRGDKIAVHQAVRDDLGLSLTDDVPLALHAYSIDVDGQFVRD